MNKTSIAESLPELWKALLETGQMVALSFLITLVFGTLVGVALRLTDHDGLRPNKAFNKVFGAIVNIFRSLPFLILLIAVIPFTRLVVGTAYGPMAAVVPLSIGAIPFFGRVVESALREVSPGKIEAARVMGASTGQIVRKVLLPEAMSPFVAGATLTLVMLIGYSAMAGTIGGGGVGDFAIRYGYQRFNTPVLLASVVVLVVVVQIIQSIGDAIVRGMAHKRD
ncbi:MAG: ABC transporter permease [Luteococcus sp.]|uniref:methionine ABC transporter permease n=1 Tax=Luteococcus sp. TaxID=1969402 RepID=UPI00264839DA|nr:methionine ABC transporter permease [Luteococcus sp.]MDN5562394.1 ABC transporter permease [Luteococcus sp.]